MTKWKEPDISIIQIMEYVGHIHGLGTDSKIYEWDIRAGGWIKKWIGVDIPKEQTDDQD